MPMRKPSRLLRLPRNDRYCAAWPGRSDCRRSFHPASAEIAAATSNAEWPSQLPCPHQSCPALPGTSTAIGMRLLRLAATRLWQPRQRRRPQRIGPDRARWATSGRRQTAGSPAGPALRATGRCTRLRKDKSGCPGARPGGSGAGPHGAPVDTLPSGGPQGGQPETSGRGTGQLSAGAVQPDWPGVRTGRVASGGWGTRWLSCPAFSCTSSAGELPTGGTSPDARNLARLRMRTPSLFEANHS